MSTVPAAGDLVALADHGRRYTSTRPVRLGDAGTDGRLRLDALARFLQDVAADDAGEVGLRASSWVVRRTVLVLHGRPSYGEVVELTTFCGGLGSRWAERRTTVTGPASRIESSSVWVFLDEASGRPAPLPPVFLDAYAETAGGRTASIRLSHPPPPEDSPRRPWPLRPSDFDLLGHVNNAVYWAVAEDDPVVEGSAELEYRTPIEPGAEVQLAGSGDDLWLVGPAGVHASVRLRRRPSSSA